MERRLSSSFPHLLPFSLTHTHKTTGGTFVTPPGWWHSHHNDSDEDAWVLPMQVGEFKCVCV